jgi:hypothetical protein
MKHLVTPSLHSGESLAKILVADRGSRDPPTVGWGNLAEVILGVVIGKGFILVKVRGVVIDEGNWRGDRWWGDGGGHRCSMMFPGTDDGDVWFRRVGEVFADATYRQCCGGWRWQCSMSLHCKNIPIWIRSRGRWGERSKALPMVLVFERVIIP